MENDIQIWGSWLERTWFPRDLQIYSKSRETETGGDTKKCSFDEDTKKIKNKNNRKKTPKNQTDRGAEKALYHFRFPQIIIFRRLMMQWVEVKAY